MCTGAIACFWAIFSKSEENKISEVPLSSQAGDEIGEVTMGDSESAMRVSIAPPTGAVDHGGGVGGKDEDGGDRVDKIRQTVHQLVGQLFFRYDLDEVSSPPRHACPPI